MQNGERMPVCVSVLAGAWPQAFLSLLERLEFLMTRAHCLLEG